MISGASTPDEMLAALMQGAGADIENLTLDFLSALNKGYSISSVAALINSENQAARNSGIWLLGEVSGEATELRDIAVGLSESSVPYHRYIFIIYLINSKLYDEEISGRAYNILEDSDIVVRAHAILWVANLGVDKFGSFLANFFNQASEHPCEFFESFEFSFNVDRKLRAVAIAAMMKCGKIIDEIELISVAEDSLTFDIIKKSNIKTMLLK